MGVDRVVYVISFACVGLSLAVLVGLVFADFRLESLRAARLLRYIVLGLQTGALVLLLVFGAATGNSTMMASWFWLVVISFAVVLLLLPFRVAAQRHRLTRGWPPLYACNQRRGA